MTIDQAVANIGKTARYVGKSGSFTGPVVIIEVMSQRVVVKVENDGTTRIVSPRQLRLV